LAKRLSGLLAMDWELTCGLRLVRRGQLTLVGLGVASCQGIEDFGRPADVLLNGDEVLPKFVWEAGLLSTDERFPAERPLGRG
jgi:hypothetical protein